MLLVAVAAGAPAAGGGGCPSYTVAHTGCDFQSPDALPCVNISLLYSSELRSQPPWGRRFMYDTGGRTISTVRDSNLDACAMQCLLDGDACQGFTLVGVSDTTATCYTVNDTEHAVTTRLNSSSYALTREGGARCKPDCGAGDGKALEPWGEPRPVARGGGRAQCEQFCDLAEATAAGSCAAFVHDEAAALCSLVNSSAPTIEVLTPQMTYRRAAPTPTPSEGKLQQWVADSSERVFEAARPWQSAFCPPSSSMAWAAAPGPFVSSQLALSLVADAAAPLSLTFTVSDLRSSPDTDEGSTIAGSLVELSQVGLVKAEACPTTTCTSGRAYTPELGNASGWYPDVLQPLGGGYPSSIELQSGRTRAVYVGLSVPSDAAPGVYTGTLTTTVGSGSGSGGSTQTTSISLTVWPIGKQCIEKQTRKFGAAYGFDHGAVSKIYPNDPEMHKTMEAFTAAHHVSSNSLDLWQSANDVTRNTVKTLLVSPAALLQLDAKRQPSLCAS